MKNKNKNKNKNTNKILKIVNIEEGVNIKEKLLIGSTMIGCVICGISICSSLASLNEGFDVKNVKNVKAAQLTADEIVSVEKYENYNYYENSENYIEIDYSKEINNVDLDRVTVGYLTDNVIVWDNAEYKSNVIGELKFNDRVLYSDCNNGWVKLYNDGYIKKEYISDTICKTTTYDVPTSTHVNGGIKSWIQHSLYGGNTNQGKLQRLAYTGDYGLRMVEDRYIIAVGSHFNTQIGQYLDLVLENGTIIQCVMGDQKSDLHTDSNHIYTYNGCCSEFIVDYSNLDSYAMFRGDVSYIYEDWQSPVVQVIVYDKCVELD